MSASVAAVGSSRIGRGWNISLWVVQVLLALAFGMAGIMKTTRPIADLAKNMNWVADLPSLVRFIGASELAGAIGLLLPSLTRIAPRLTPLAAVGLVTVMILAAAFHISRGEFAMMPPSVILGLLSAFVAWGRFVKAPILPR
jgi:putative oxidoreductase